MFKPTRKIPGTGSVAIGLLFVFFALIIFPAWVDADAVVVLAPEIIIAHHALPQALDAPLPAPVAKIVVPAALVPIKKILAARLLIPSINVDAVIKDMGTTVAGAMAVPGNRIDVGWFSPGTRPGDIGSAVISGHNRWDGGSGVFVRLNELVKGDILTVVDAQGVSTSFVVTEMRDYNPTADGTDIFRSAAGIHLNLITCSGVWDAKTKSYTKRLVVFADSLPV